MSGKPAARATDPAICLASGHGSNPIAHGSSDAVFDGLPAARQGDVSACGSPMILTVSSTILINGPPAVALGSIGAHGNVVIGGSGAILIGDVFTPVPRTSVPPLNRNSVPRSGRFQLTDHETGKPVAGRRARIWSSGGWNAFDTTDADGMTSWIERPTRRPSTSTRRRGATHERPA